MVKYDVRVIRIGGGPVFRYSVTDKLTVRTYFLVSRNWPAQEISHSCGTRRFLTLFKQRTAERNVSHMNQSQAFPYFLKPNYINQLIAQYVSASRYISEQFSKISRSFTAHHHKDFTSTKSIRTLCKKILKTELL